MRAKFLGTLLVTTSLATSLCGFNHRLLEEEAKSYCHRIVQEVPTDAAIIKDRLPLGCLRDREEDTVEEKYKDRPQFLAFCEGLKEKISNDSFKRFVETCKSIYDEYETDSVRKQIIVHMLLEKVTAHFENHLKFLEKADRFKNRKAGGQAAAAAAAAQVLPPHPSPAEKQREREKAPERRSAPALGEWAPAYDFTDTDREWQQQLREWQRQLRTPEVRRKFYEDPDFIAAYQPINDCHINLEIEHPLTGVVLFRTMARKIGLAPLKERFSDAEIDFLSTEMLEFAMALQGEMNNFKWVPHELRDLPHDDIKKDTTSDFSKRRLNLKKALYARIPWRKLEGLGKFAHRLKEKDVGEKRVFEAALPELIQDFRMLTQDLGRIITFYQEEMNGELSWEVPVSSSFPAISTLGALARDRDSLRRLEVGITSLVEGVAVAPLTHRYATLRVLNILGECSVVMSPRVKAGLMSKNSWSAFKNIRNSFHNNQAQNKIHEFFSDQENLLRVQNDLRLFLQRIRDTGHLFEVGWQDISAFYAADPGDEVAWASDSIIDLNRMIAGHLTLQEERALIETTWQSFEPDLESHNFMRYMLLEAAEVDRGNRELFQQHLERVKASKGEKKKLEDLYKKRCTAQKNGEILISSEEDLDEIREILSLKKVRKNLEETARKVHEYNKWGDLEKQLKSIGLDDDELVIWRESYKKTKLRSVVQKDDVGSGAEKIALLCTRIDAVLREINAVLSPYKEMPSEERTDNFLRDVPTSLAVQYLIGSFRETAQTLWDIVSSMSSGGDRRLLQAADVLNRCIRVGKEILHNHDITELSTLTESGERSSIMLNQLPFLFGDLLKIKFLIKKSFVTITLWNDEELKIPVVDARSLLPKRERTKNNRGVKKRDYPPLGEIERSVVQHWLETARNKGLPLGAIYNNLTLAPFVEPRYLVYTPPVMDTSLAEILDLLTSQKIKLPKKSQKPSAPERTILGTRTVKFPTGDKRVFNEIAIPEDNDCALHCLGISRKGAAELLLIHAAREDIRDLVSPEIWEAFRENKMPGKMRNEAYRALQKRYVGRNTLYDTAVREGNNALGTEGVTAEELLSRPTFPNAAALIEARNNPRDVEREIVEYTRRQDVFEDFVKYYVGQPGQWLSYIRGLGAESRTTSLDAIAHLKEVPLLIYVKDSTTQELSLVHYFSGTREPIMMFHTHGLTHFNLLEPQ